MITAILTLLMYFYSCLGYKAVLFLYITIENIPLILQSSFDRGWTRAYIANSLFGLTLHNILLDKQESTVFEFN